MWLARVQDLIVYPLKSARACPRREVQVEDRGLAFDRHWMLVDERGRFLTQRTHPRLAILPVQVHDDCLTLGPTGAQGLLTVPSPESAVERPPPLRRIEVWSHHGDAEDCGDAAAAWCSEFLGQTVRLVHAGESLKRHANPAMTQGDAAPIAFSDGYPILVCNQASLDDLGHKMGARLNMNAFRPNIVLAELPPWAEDEIERIEIGRVTLRLCKPCVRCVIPSIDQATGLPGPNPTPTLKQHRWNKALRGVTFGENAYALQASGLSIRIGDEAHCFPRSGDDLRRP
jgi:uncharacterized protein YcbX